MGYVKQNQPEGLPVSVRRSQPSLFRGAGQLPPFPKMMLGIQTLVCLFSLPSLIPGDADMMIAAIDEMHFTSDTGR